MSHSTKDRILDAARDLFVERGEAAVTMRAVAGLAGVSTMAAYRHFPNREALLLAVSLYVPILLMIKLSNSATPF